MKQEFLLQLLNSSEGKIKLATAMLSPMTNNMEESYPRKFFKTHFLADGELQDVMEIAGRASFSIREFKQSKDKVALMNKIEKKLKFSIINEENELFWNLLTEIHSSEYIIEDELYSLAIKSPRLLIHMKYRPYIEKIKRFHNFESEKLNSICYYVSNEFDYLFVLNEDAGMFYVRNDITILSSDNPGNSEIGWTVFEVVGMEIFPDAIKKFKIRPKGNNKLRFMNLQGTI